MTRYAANLLFEYGVKQAPKSRPLCEKRIVVFKARGPRDAIRRAKQHGKRGEYSYRNGYDQTVQVKFIGFIDVIDLEFCDAAEAYYSLRRMSNPKKHVRPDSRLSVSASNLKPIGSSWWAAPALGRPKAHSKRRTRR